jgi:hypothetical protein
MSKLISTPIGVEKRDSGSFASKIKSFEIMGKKGQIFLWKN